MKKVKTSQPNPNLFVQAFEEQLDLGYDYVICLTLSKGLSGTVNSANLAQKILDNPHVIVIDSQTVGPGVEYLLECADKAIEAGNTFEEVIKVIQDRIPTVSFLFSVEQLEALVAGGRLSKLQAIVGNLLKIKPILKFKEGVLTVLKKVRGTQGIMSFLSTYIAEHSSAEQPGYAKTVYVDNVAKVKELEHEIYQKAPEIQMSLHGAISAVIATHLGYSGLGVLVVERT